MSARKPKHSRPPAPPQPYASGKVPWTESPIVLTFVFGVLWLFGTLLFAGFRYSSQTAAMVLYHLLVDGGTVAIWLASAIGYGLPLLGLFRLSEIHVDPPLRLVTAAALGLGAMGLATLGLGLAGVLAPWSAIALVATGALILVTMIAMKMPTGLRMRPRLVTPWAWASLLAVPSAVIATMAALMPPGLMWGADEPNGYDVVEYHLQVPREWYEAHRIFPLHHNVFSYMPFNMEMHYLLAMHLRGGPWVGMYAAQLMHLSLVALAVLAVYAVAQRVGNSPAIGVLAAVAASTVPWLAMVGSVAYDEGAFLLYSTLAIGWAMLALGRRLPRQTSLILAGVMAGLACGAKLTAVPEVLGAGAIGLLLIARRENDTTRMGWKLLVSGAVTYLAAGLLVFSPWLVRNEIWAKNPVFPEAARLIGAGTFSPAQVQRWEQAYAPKGREATAAGRAGAFWQQVVADWRFGFILLPLGAAGAVLGGSKPAARFAVLQILSLLVIWMGFTHLQGRFFLISVPLCALLLAHLPWERMGRRGHAAITFIIAIAAIGGAVGLEQKWSALVDQHSLITMLGVENLDWPHGPNMLVIPDGSTLVLVGDAKAFWYTRPMSLLKYHTVFDVAGGASEPLLKGYGANETTGYLMVDPGELNRYMRTYQPFPAIPPLWSQKYDAFSIPPGSASK